jgi:hypothetical protein
MANQESLRSISIIAATGLNDKQYHFVDINSSGQIILSVLGARVVGVLQDKPGQNSGATPASDNSLGHAGSVALASSGVLKVVAGGTITAGQEIKSDASGQAVDATTEVTNHYVAGIALTSAAAGELVEYTPFIYRQAV